MALTSAFTLPQVTIDYTCPNVSLQCYPLLLSVSYCLYLMYKGGFGHVRTRKAEAKCSCHSDRKAFHESKAFVKNQTIHRLYCILGFYCFNRQRHLFHIVSNPLHNLHLSNIVASMFAENCSL